MITLLSRQECTPADCLHEKHHNFNVFLRSGFGSRWINEVSWTQPAWLGAFMIGLSLSTKKPWLTKVQHKYHHWYHHISFVLLCTAVLQSFSGLTRCSMTFLGAVLHIISCLFWCYLIFWPTVLAWTVDHARFVYHPCVVYIYQCFTSTMEANSIEIRYLSLSSTYIHEYSALFHLPQRRSTNYIIFIFVYSIIHRYIYLIDIICFHFDFCFFLGKAQFDPGAASQGLRDAESRFALF